MIRACWRAAALWPLLACAVLVACSKGPQPGEVLDEARLAGRDAASFLMPPRTTSTTWTAASR
jgi:hypothetical protein